MNASFDQPLAEDDRAMIALGGPEWIQDMWETVASGDVYADPTATEDDIQAWEDAHEVKLPTEYRLFLRYIGNGLWDSDKQDHLLIAGIPAANELARRDAETITTEKALITASFPLTSGTGYGFPDELRAEEEKFNYDKELNEYFTQSGKIVTMSSLGTYRIRGEKNDDRLVFLIVTGPQRGNVWQLDRAEYQDSSSTIRFDTKGSFSEWLTDWEALDY